MKQPGQSRIIDGYPARLLSSSADDLRSRDKLLSFSENAFASRAKSARLQIAALEAGDAEFLAGERAASMPSAGFFLHRMGLFLARCATSTARLYHAVSTTDGKLQQGNTPMIRRSFVTTIVAGLTLAAGGAAAQPSDIDGIKATSNAFYEALAKFDGGASMEKIWANKAYITFAGPRSKSFLVGWDALKGYWADTDKLFIERKASLSDSRIHIVGNLAWEVGREVGETKLKDGATRPVNHLMTRIYEKIDGRWLIVSHHAQPVPQ